MPSCRIKMEIRESDIDCHIFLVHKKYSMMIISSSAINRYLHLAIMQGFVEVVFSLIRLATSASQLNIPNDLGQVCNPWEKKKTISGSATPMVWVVKT